MPKKSSVFSVKKGYKRKFKTTPKVSQKPQKRQIPFAAMYTAMNKISSILMSLNELKHDVFGERCPELLKGYVSRSQMELHALQKLLNDKLPDSYTEDAEHKYADYDNSESPRTVDDDSKKEATSFEEDIHKIEEVLATLDNSPKKKLARELTTLGVMVGLRELSIGKSPRAKQYLSLHGSLLKACRELLKFWKEEREQICANNKHDAAEYKDLKESLSQDLDEGNEFISNLT